MIQAVLTAILFAMSAVSAGRLTQLLSAGTANLSRLALAALMLALWAHTFGQGITGDALPWLVASGLIGFGLGDVALYAAYYRIGPQLAVLLCLCLAAPIGALMEWLWLGTRLTLGQVFWGSVVLVGVLTALAPGSQAVRATRRPISGIVLGIIAAVGQAGGAVLTRRAYQAAATAGQQIDGMTAAYQRILGGLLITAAIVLIRRRCRFGRTSREVAVTERPWRRAWPWVVLTALCGPALGVACFQWALAVAPTGTVLAIVATTPLLVIPFAMLVDGEHPTLHSLTGGAIAVVGAAVLVYR